MKKPNEIRVMKTINEMICPHCSKPMMVSIKSSLPLVDWILKKEDIEDAKKKLKTEVEKIKFKKKERKENVLRFIDDPENMFGPDEVQVMLDQILAMNEVDDKKPQA